MQKYKVSVSGVLEADVDVIAGRFSKIFKVDSVKAKVLVTAGNQERWERTATDKRHKKSSWHCKKMGLEGVVEPPFSEAAEHLAI